MPTKTITTLADLTPDNRNPRKHPERNIRAIAKSLEEVGAARSIVIDENGMVLCGNGLIDGAGIAGIENVQVVESDGNTIIAVRRSNLTDTQKKRLKVLDNRASELAEWDSDVLSELIGEGVDLSDLWFEDELAALLAEPMQIDGGLLLDVDPDAIPENVETRVKPGDLWQLGKHRLLCGDSTNVSDVERVLDGKRVDCMLTDPPYGLGDTDSVKNNYDIHVDTQENLIQLIADILPIGEAYAERIVLTPGNGNQWLYPKPNWVMAWFTPAGVGSGPWGFCCWQPILCYGKDPYLP